MSIAGIAKTLLIRHNQSPTLEAQIGQLITKVKTLNTISIVWIC